MVKDNKGKKEVKEINLLLIKQKKLALVTRRSKFIDKGNNL